MKPVMVEWRGCLEEIDFPSCPRIAYHTIDQPLLNIAWAEKMALKARIEELEADLKFKVDTLEKAAELLKSMKEDIKTYKETGL